MIFQTNKHVISLCCFYLVERDCVDGIRETFSSKTNFLIIVSALKKVMEGNGFQKNHCIFFAMESIWFFRCRVSQSDFVYDADPLISSEDPRNCFPHHINKNDEHTY